MYLTGLAAAIKYHYFVSLNVIQILFCICQDRYVIFNNSLLKQNWKSTLLCKYIGKCNQTIYLCKHFTAVPQMMTNRFCKQLFALCWKDRLTTATKCVKMGNSFTNKNALSEQQQEMLEIFWKDKRFFMWNKKPQIKHSNWVICRKCICRLLIMCYQFRYVPRP